MKRIPLLTIPVILFLTSCATGYHSRGFWGDGYSEIITNPDSFVVTFKGNGYTSGEKTLRYVLLRASEITIENGYKYFVVMSSIDQTSSHNYSNTSANVYANGFVSTSTYSGTTVKPGTSIRIKCYKEKPQTDDAIDAAFYWKANKEE